MLEFKDVTIGFRQSIFSSREKRILSDISFSLGEGECLGIVGKSGSGKTTLASAALGLVPCQQGQVRIAGQSVHSYRRKELARQIQLVTQNPETSFDPDWPIEKSLAEIAQIHRLLPRGASILEKVRPLLADVGMASADLQKPPRRFSGGELQRLSIVRALLLPPKILIFDEADSMLDTAIRLTLFDTLHALRQKYRISFLYITHDIRVVSHLAERVLVLEKGSMVEYGPVDLLLHSDVPLIKTLRESIVMHGCTPPASA